MPSSYSKKIQQENIASRSILRSAYLERQLQPLYGLGPWIECRYWLRGLNDTYRVRTADGGAYMLRVYRAEALEEEIAFELELLERLQSELSGTAAEASPAVRLSDGRLYSALQAPEGIRFAALFQEADGTEDPLQSEEACRAFGLSAAALHAAMDRLSAGTGADGASGKPLPPRAPADLDMLLRRPLRIVLGYIGEDHPEAPFLRRYAQGLETAAAEAAANGLDFGLCHGDMHGNNNALRQADRFAHFDFEFAAPGWRAWDLAQVKNRKRQAAEQIEPLWQAFLAGYRSIRPFTEADEAAVGTFALVRRFWTMGLDAELAPMWDGALDFGEDWLAGFVEEFRRSEIGQDAAVIPEA